LALHVLKHARRSGGAHGALQMVSFRQFVSPVHADSSLQQFWLLHVSHAAPASVSAKNPGVPQLIVSVKSGGNAASVPAPPPGHSRW